MAIFTVQAELVATAWFELLRTWWFHVPDCVDQRGWRYVFVKWWARHHTDRHRYGQPGQPDNAAHIDVSALDDIQESCDSGAGAHRPGNKPPAREPSQPGLLAQTAQPRQPDAQPGQLGQHAQLAHPSQPDQPSQPAQPRQPDSQTGGTPDLSEDPDDNPWARLV